MGAYLAKQAKTLINSQLDEMSVQELKQYVQRFGQIMSLKKAVSQHTAIAELIKEVTDSYEFLDSLQVIIQHKYRSFATFLSLLYF